LLVELAFREDILGLGLLNFLGVEGDVLLVGTVH
jgi:hypothetical protein